MILNITLRNQKLLTLSVYHSNKAADRHLPSYLPKMNSRLLGRNGRLLMPILAILLMNVRVAEARLDWPEGTKGNIAMAGWFITSIAFGVGMAGAIMHAYRTFIDRRTILSDVELCNQIRESGEWLAYTVWIRAESPTAHPLERVAAARIFDLERQLFGVPPPPRPLFSRLFSCFSPSKLLTCLFGTAKNGGFTTTPTSGDESINDGSRRSKEMASGRHHIPHTKISNSDGASSATIIKNDGKIVAHCSVSSARSAIPSKEFTTHKTTTKDGGKKAIDRNVSMNKTADNTHKRPNQNVIAPPPKVHTAATSSNHDNIPAGSAAASRHSHVALPLLKLGLDPIRPSWKPLPSSNIPDDYYVSGWFGSVQERRV